MFGRVSLLEVLEGDIAIANLNVSGAVVSGRSTLVELHLGEPVIGKFVHQAVQKSRGAVAVQSKISVVEVVGLCKERGFGRLGETVKVALKICVRTK